jgi:hypothetical protein
MYPVGDRRPFEACVVWFAPTVDKPNSWDQILVDAGCELPQDRREAMV